MTTRSRIGPRALAPLLIATFILILSPNFAIAQDLSPVASMLTTVQAALTGPIGKAIATIAVIGVGYACFLGRLNWTLFAMVLVGAVLVFFADDLIDGFAP